MAVFWCWWCYYLVLVVPLWWCRPHISSRSHRRARAKFLSAVAVSLVNRSCRARLTDMITLIINYLGAPLGIAFIGW